MKTQEYLRSGKTLEDLTQEYGIIVNKHDTLPLVILNYDQIESKKTEQIVRECRALVLHSETFEIIAKSMNRFFNWGEMADEMPLFNWDTATVYEKVDGSLCLFYHFNGEWHVNTRGSFANASLFNTQWQAEYHKMPMGFTWKQGILHALGMKDLSELNGVLDQTVTYVCEFCSPWNKVVRHYEPCIYNLTAFRGLEEIGPQSFPFFKPVEIYPLKTADDVMEYIKSHPEATWEGVVVKDHENRRWKLKNARYLSLHKMKGNNGYALYNPSTLLPFILEGEGDELLAIYPEVTNCFNSFKSKVDDAYKNLELLWNANKDIVNQKEFALSIVGKTPLTGILFNARKKNTTLKEEWRKSEDMIFKALFK
jgi:hypothetical protein